MMQNLTRIFFVNLFSLCLLISGAVKVTAEDLYSWQDSSGVVVFGGNPPKDARYLKKVPQRPLSRYSSDKLISGFKVKPREPRENSKSSLQGSLHQENFRFDSNRARLERKAANKAGEKTAISKSARLSYQAPSLQTNEKGEVTSCSVSVKNEGAATASKISVQLTFPDGSFLSTIGPDKLDPTQEGIYGIPSSSLPLKLNLGNSAKPQDMQPEVLLSYE